MSEGRRWVKPAGGAVAAAVLACAACCAGPLIGIVGGIGAASLLGAYWIPGLLVLTAAAGVGLTILLVRRRRAKACRVPSQSLGTRTSVELVSASEVPGR